ncbi:GNAT family N-acetyltransferase [Siccibacter turicensis]|uniref:GNAT family N-acetyltransferase n=1 Tax=Siccibacter turicensis TaxID=357233 RepID=UPI00102060CC|nr:GNAT family protein [Siccibacter turicensis]
MMTLTTPRLTLTPFQPADWAFFLALRQDPVNMQFMAPISTVDQIRQTFEARRANPAAFILRAAGEATPLGEAGLLISQPHPEVAEVGYSVVQAAQGKGYASEALRALCEHGLHTMGLEAIHAWALADNAGSVRVLEKLGFERIQVLEKAYLLNGVYHDDCQFRLVASHFTRKE